MVQIDVPIAFAAGSIFADAARNQLRFGRAEHHYRAMLKNNLFQIFFFSWIPVYFLLNYFGWETTHMWWHAPSVTDYPLYIPIFLLVFFASANAGFLLGRSLVRRGRTVANRIVYLSILAYSAIWIFAQTNRTFYLGTYDEWSKGTARIFYEDPVFVRMLALTLVVFAVGLAGFWISLRREGRHLDIPVDQRSAAAAGR